jgi:hypothetical protein
MIEGDRGRPILGSNPGILEAVEEESVKSFGL